MNKFYGNIGFVMTVETAPGVWKEKPIERPYYGEVLKNMKRWQSVEHLNDDLNITNEFSVLMDEFAFQNFRNMRYIEWMGAYWKINSVQVEHPRLRISVGGVYNREEPFDAP